MGRPYFDLVLPTTKHERVLGLSTLSYKTATGRPHSDPVLPTTKLEITPRFFGVFHIKVLNNLGLIKPD